MTVSYALSTVDPQSHTPAVRFVIHRGFVNERRDEKDVSDNAIEDGDEPWTSNCLLTCSDVRAPKVQHMLGSPAKGGAIVELAWWFLPVGEQFRIRGRAFIVDPSKSTSSPGFPPERCAPPTPQEVNKGKPFDWEQERLRIYEKLSPVLKASFGRPAPSQPTDEDPETWPKELEEGDKELKELALSRFALIVIEPLQVDWAYLQDLPHRRSRFTNKDGTWHEEQIVP